MQLQSGLWRLLAAVFMAGKLPARSPSDVRVAADVRTPGRENRARVFFPRSIVWVILALGLMLLILIGTLLIALALLR